MRNDDGTSDFASGKTWEACFDNSAAPKARVVQDLIVDSVYGTIRNPYPKFKFHFKLGTSKSKKSRYSKHCGKQDISGKNTLAQVKAQHIAQTAWSFNFLLHLGCLQGGHSGRE